jgi:hypothetical protein
VLRRPAEVALIALFAGLVAAGCGSGGSSKAADAATPAASGGVTPPAPKKTLTAEQVATALKDHGLPVKKITVFDEKSDPNKRLGRPGQYTSKVTFIDSRVKNGQPNDISSGGSVEVFEEAADALARGQYIQTTIRAMPVVGAEYDYLSGGVLLRVAGELPPSAAKAYRAALESIAGGPIVTPKPSHT